MSDRSDHANPQPPDDGRIHDGEGLANALAEIYDRVGEPTES